MRPKPAGADAENPGEDAAVAEAVPSLDDPALYLNRELSLLEFQRRVLEEAQETDKPLLERVSFIAIFGSNIDELFMVRVAALKQQLACRLRQAQPGRPDGIAAACGDPRNRRGVDRAGVRLLARPAGAGAGGGRHPHRRLRLAERRRAGGRCGNTSGA